jgi:hypothetical protein
MIRVNEITKPEYEGNGYYVQTATGNPEQDQYQMNLELLQNSFRVGYYPNPDYAKFSNLYVFPYREDNIP